MNHSRSMHASPVKSPSVIAAARQYWRDLCAHNGSRAATTGLIQAIWSFVRNSTRNDNGGSTEILISIGNTA